MKMKVLISLCFVAVAFAYSDLDNFDYDALLADPEKELQLMDCFIDAAPCTGAALVAKGHLLETVKDACKECSDIQRHAYHKFLDAIKKLNPEEFEKYKAKYDFDGKHYQVLEKALDKY